MKLISDKIKESPDIEAILNKDEGIDIQIEKLEELGRSRRHRLNDTYRCGACGQAMHETQKKCPSCGVIYDGDDMDDECFAAVLAELRNARRQGVTESRGQIFKVKEEPVNGSKEMTVDDRNYNRRRMLIKMIVPGMIVVFGILLSVFVNSTT